MANWIQRLGPPAGALPGNIITKVGAGALLVLIIGLVLSTLLTDGSLDEGEQLAGTEPGLTGQGQVAQLDARLTDLQDRQQRQREREVAAAAEREAAAARVAAGLGALPGGVTAAGMGVPGVPPADGEVDPSFSTGGGGGSESPRILTADEIELTERLRLEALERRARSLRTPAVVQTFRSPPSPVSGGSVAGPAAAPPAAAAAPQGAFPMPDTGALIGQIQDAARAAGALTGEGSGGTVPGVTGPEVAATAAPVTVTTPDDPAGFERVYEGSVLSAVLVTQLSGDFAGPVLAQVAIPFYSADRQRILIPRGARILGTAQPVRDQDQSRLAVGFHRLVWPDGRWVDLSFHGLNAVGEGALRDQVNRHYVSMFAAAGAVGVISGLTLQGANPYAGGGAGFQAGVSQGLGQSASQMLDRFLNRLPTITIRTGHRLRIWLTADVLVPRPAPHPERMFR